MCLKPFPPCSVRVLSLCHSPSTLTFSCLPFVRRFFPPFSPPPLPVPIFRVSLFPRFIFPTTVPAPFFLACCDFCLCLFYYVAILFPSGCNCIFLSFLFHTHPCFTSASFHFPYCFLLSFYRHAYSFPNIKSIFPRPLVFVPLPFWPFFPHFVTIFLSSFSISLLFSCFSIVLSCCRHSSFPFHFSLHSTSSVLLVLIPIDVFLPLPTLSYFHLFL